MKTKTIGIGIMLIASGAIGTSVVAQNNGTGIARGTSAPIASDQTAGTITSTTDKSGLRPDSGGPTILYTLDDDSGYATGCFYGLCRCPIRFTGDFNGSFGARFDGFDKEGFRILRLSNINWSVGFGETRIMIRGTGVYRRTFGEDGLQQLTLDVTVNGTPSTFDSGVVSAAGVADTDIDINVLQFGPLASECFDTSLFINASPGLLGPPVEIPAADGGDSDGDPVRFLGPPIPEPNDG